MTETTTTSRELGTVAQGAAYAKCSQKTIWRYINAGRITAYRFGPRMVRIDMAELDAIIRPIPNARTGRGAA